jgi:hypothetical protein
MNYVDVAEKIWLIPILGYDWYDEIQEQVLNNNVSEENATALVEAIWPYLGFCIMYEALPSIAYHASEVSLTKGKSDISDPLTLKEIGYYQEHIRRQVEARKDFLKKWICEHYEYYPLADVCACECSCCKHAELNYPNPNKELYTTRRKCTDLK